MTRTARKPEPDVAPSAGSATAPTTAAESDQLKDALVDTLGDDQQQKKR
jgi:hypothetical protein